MGTDRNITPTKQMEGSPAGTTTGSASLGWAAGSESGDTERSTTITDRIIPAGTDTVEISNSAVGIGGRWLQDLHRRWRFRARLGRYSPQGCLPPISGEVAWESHGFGRGLFPTTAH
jgi:hypothetical protein